VSVQWILEKKCRKICMPNWVDQKLMLMIIYARVSVATVVNYHCGDSNNIVD